MTTKNSVKNFDIDTAKDLINRAVEELKQLNIFKPEPYRFFIKEDFDTASWSYRPPHYIVLGADIFKHFTAKEEDKSDFFLKLLFHEVAHSIYTDYRLFKIIKILEERDLPFEVFNLFEDARVEHRLLKENNIKMISDFNWSKCMELDTPYDSLDLFYWIVQKNGSKKSFDIVYRLLNSDLKLDSQRVWGFYEKTINAKDSYEVIDIVGEWMRKMQDKTLNIGNNLFHGELEILNSPNSIISQIKGAHEIINITIEDLKNRQIATNDTSSLKNLYSIKQLSSKNLLEKENARGDFDKKLLQTITKEIEHLFIDDRRYKKTSTPSKRLNIRNLLLKNQNVYKKRTKDIKKKKFTIVLDISGSMSGIIEDMLILVEVFNILSKKGLVDGYLILSVSFYLDEAAYQTFKFPLKQDVLKKIVSYAGTEGLAEVMKNLSKLLKPSDAVFVFTDGLFADDPLNRSFFHRNNIDLYGVFLDKDKKGKYNLLQYFDKEIVDSDVEKLAFKIVEMLKRKIGG